MSAKPPTNPWGLTTCEAELMDTLCRVGSIKAAARVLKRSPKTLETYGTRIGARMAESHPILKALMWDRWRRDNPREPITASTEPPGPPS